MSPELIFYTILIVGSLLILIMTGTWICFALYGVSIFALMFLGRGNMQHTLESVLFNSVGSYTLVAMPLFILMGEMLIRSGCGENLFTGVKKILSPFPGGLLHTNVGACAFFSACTGSSTATTVAIGSFSIPELIRQGYNREITLGSICAGGTLGILIPPSIMMILYGSLTGNSIGKLFIAGLIPGLVLAGMMMLYIAIICTINPKLAPKRTSFGGLHYIVDVLTSFKYTWPILVLIGGIMGSIFLGLATPTEAGAVSALFAFLVWVLIYRTFTFKAFMESVRETVIINAQLMQ